MDLNLPYRARSRKTFLEPNGPIAKLGRIIDHGTKLLSRHISHALLYSRYARRPIYLQTGSLRLTLQDGSQKPPKNRGSFSSYISRPEHAVNSEQTSYYSFVHKMTVAACFNFIGATKADLQTALLDLLFPPLQDDHQVSLPNSIPDRFFGLRFTLLLVI